MRGSPHEALGERPAGSKDEHRDCMQDSPSSAATSRCDSPLTSYEDECPTLLLGKLAEAFAPARSTPPLGWRAVKSWACQGASSERGQPGRGVGSHTGSARWRATKHEVPPARPYSLRQPGERSSRMSPGEHGCIFPIAQVPRAKSEYSTGVLVVESAQEIDIDCVTSRRNGGGCREEPDTD